MDLRFCFVDSETGEGCTIDLQVAALNALAIGDALNQVDGMEEDPVVGVFMEMHGTTCAVVLRNDRYIMTGIGYTVFDRNYIPADYHGSSQLSSQPGCTNPAMHAKFAERGIEDQCGYCPAITLGERLAPGCSCGASIESNRCTCD